MLYIKRLNIIRINDRHATCEFEIQVKRDDDSDPISIPLTLQIAHPEKWSLDGLQAKAIMELKSILRYMGESDRLHKLDMLA